MAIFLKKLLFAFVQSKWFIKPCSPGLLAIIIWFRGHVQLYLASSQSKSRSIRQIRILVLSFRDGSIANKDKHGKQQTPNKQLQELKPKALVTRILIARVKQA